MDAPTATGTATTATTAAAATSQRYDIQMAVSPASTVVGDSGNTGHPRPLPSSANRVVNNPMPHLLPEGENAAPLEVIGTTASDKLVIIMVGLPATGMDIRCCCFLLWHFTVTILLVVSHSFVTLIFFLIQFL
jgi:hypothetical protein